MSSRIIAVRYIVMDASDPNMGCHAELVEPSPRDAAAVCGNHLCRFRFLSIVNLCVPCAYIRSLIWERLKLAAMTTSPPTEGQQFRSSVPGLFIFILVVSFAMSLPVAFVTAVAIRSQIPQETGEPVTPGRILFAMALIGPIYPILSLIGACLLSRFCPTTISPDGVTTQSFTGGRRFVRWQDITTAKTLRALNLKWILVYAVNESKAIQVPLFQPRLAEFIQEIQRLAPPGNPILNQLR